MSVFKGIREVLDAVQNIWFNKNTNDLADGTVDFWTEKRVGIGVNNPITELDVNGNFNLKTTGRMFFGGKQFLAQNYNYVNAFEWGDSDFWDIPSYIYGNNAINYLACLRTGISINTDQNTAKLDINGDLRVRDLPNLQDQVVTSDVSGNIGRSNILDLITNNSGQIKLNWTNATRPSSGKGFTANTPKSILLNQNYTVSSSPTTTYPYLATDLVGGTDVIDSGTNYLRELKPGQYITFRVKFGYINKGAGQNGKITLRMYNPNPGSSFEIIKCIPAPDGTTEYVEEFEFIAIADGLSLDPLYGYGFEGETSFSDGNLEIYIQNITAFYQATEINLK